MSHFLDVARTGLAAVRLHRLRSVVCIVAIVVVLLPYLVGLGLAKGIEEQAETSVRQGADLYVAGSQFGRPAPIPLEAIPRIRQIDGVTDVVPRIIGEVLLGKDQVHTVLVGLPSESFPAWADCIEGELPKAGGPNELVVGTTLARRLGLKVGSVLPPFYRNDRTGDRLSRVVGVFKPDAPLWQANLILTTFDTAAAVFAQQGLATDLLVSCRPGYQAAVTRAILNEPSFPGPADRGAIRLRVTAREDLLALLPSGLLHREGIFNLHFLLAFVVGILVLLVTSGFGLSDRRREIGILKATGWQTDEILLRGLVESCCLSLTAACVALVLAWVWLRICNGFAIAALFLAGVGVTPDFPVPFRLTPVPALLSFVLSFAVVLTGTLYSSWRAATAPPRLAIR
jgi:ABC-type lipoprotein release transport system permease subunit